MSMLTAHFSNLCMTPAIVKKLLGFRVTPAIQAPNAASSGQTAAAASTATSTTSMDTSGPGSGAGAGTSVPSSPSAGAVAASNLDISPSSVCSSSSASSSCHSPPASLLIKNSTLHASATDSQQQQHHHNKMCEKAIRTLVKKLRKTPGALDELERAITTRDPTTKCIIVPMAKPNGASGMGHQVISRKTLPHVVYCRIWRFADLQSCNELKPVPHCQYGYSHHHYQQAQAAASSGKMNNEEQMVCINPYHYDRIECQNGSVSGTSSQQSHQPLTVYVPAKLQLQQQQQQQSTGMDGLMPSLGQLGGGGGGGSASHMHDELMAGVSASSFMHANMQHPVNSPSPPSSASILSPSSIGSNGGLNSQFSPFISEDDASEINSLISPSPPLMTSVAFGSTPAAVLSSSHQQYHQIQPPQQHHHHLQQQQQQQPQQQGGPNSSVGSPMDLLPVPMVPQPYWCSISYYEMKTRVGEMFHVAATVNSVTIDGYTDPSSAQRFCLGVLSNVNRPQEVEMTRHYIGRGLMLSYENGQVFAECLSENPVFVQSPNCNQRYNWHLATVVKIPPKCSLKIFDEADFVQVANETVYQGFEAVYALTRICTIRISFVKGWGADYRRQTILNTPCWIEVHLNNPLKLVDQILTKMGSPRTIATSVS